MLGRFSHAISFGLLLAFIFGLRIADSLGQHLVKLSLGLLRVPASVSARLGYVGMPELELNPVRGREITAAICRRILALP